MCGRYVLTSPLDVLKARFRVGMWEGGSPRFNVAPRQRVPVVLAEEFRRVVRSMEWGLLPAWVKEREKALRPINARAETVAVKPSYRSALRARRVLVPADGFYEWRRTAGGGKEPVFFRPASGRPFAFAGLFDRWTASGPEVLETFTLLTTTPNALVARVHDRMPVILAEEDEEAWLDPRCREPADLLPLLRSYPEEEMEAFVVSAKINSPSNDDPSVLGGMTPLD